MTDEKLFYSVAEVQQLLGISRPTVYNLIRRKEFKWITVGKKGYRISRSSFDEWLESRMANNMDITAEDSDTFEALCDKMSRMA